MKGLALQAPAAMQARCRCHISPPILASCSYPVRLTARATQGSGAGRKSRSTVVRVRAGPVQIDEQDLMQNPDRHKWYEAKFCADDMPDWNPGTLVSSQMVSPEYRAITFTCEISRERVPLRNAYKHVGQRATLRVNSSAEYQVTVASAPFSQLLNKVPLYNVRGDLFANEVKTGKPEPASVQAEVTVLVSKKDAPEVFGLSELDVLEVGPFTGTGLDLRSSPLMAIYRYPTLVMFASGKGIASAKALIEASPDVASLNVRFRKDVRLYYKAPNEASLCFKEDFEKWEEMGVQVYTTTRSFQDAFDDDDTLMYDPEYTGAIVLTGGDAEAEKEALTVCSDAEITQVLTDKAEQSPVVHLSSIPKTFSRWAVKSGASHE